MSHNISLKELENLKDSFLEYIEIERGRSLLTVRNYTHYLNRFFKFLKDNKYTTIDRVSTRALVEIVNTSSVFSIICF